MKKRERLTTYLIGVLVLGGIVCMGLIGAYYLGLYQTKSEISILKESVEYVSTDDEKLNERFKIDFLREENMDTAFWLYMEGVGIDLPVMYSPNNPQNYLRKNFEQEYSLSGLPFVDERGLISPMDNNVVIYGHNMQDGSMFGSLVKYKDKEFYLENSSIDLLTDEGMKVYKIMSVFEGKIGDDFPYYDYVGQLDENRFDEYVGKCKDKALYDTEVSASYGDELLTLSTCDGDDQDGRLVVVGVLQEQLKD